MRYLLLLFLLPLSLRAQPDPCRFSLAVADHIVTAEPCKMNMKPTMSDILEGEKALAKGQFKYARRSFIQALRAIWESKDPNRQDGKIVIDLQKTLATNDRRPAIIKLSEKIPLSELNQNEAENFTRTLNDLGIYYHSVGMLNLADLMFTKALKAQGDAIGKTSKNYVCTLHNLGNLRKDQGRYSDADQIFNYLLNYYGKTGGKNSCEYVICLNNKALLDWRVGRKEKALQAFEEIEAMDLGVIFLSGSFEKQRIQTNRALLFRAEGKEEECFSMLQKVKLYYEENKHKRHLDYYDVILEMAISPLADTLSSEISLEIIDEILNDIQKDYTENSAYYARVLRIKADRLIKEKSLEEALLVYEQITLTYKNTYYDRHPDYLDALIDKAQLQWILGKVHEASGNLKQALKAYQYILEKEFQGMTEVDQGRFWTVFKPNIELIQGFAISQKDIDPQLMEEAYNMEINSKGLILNNSKRIRDEVLGGSDLELKAKFKQWLSLKEDLSYYYSVDEEGLKEEEIDLQALETSAQELEREINLKSKNLSSLQSSGKLIWQDIQTQLTSGQALVEIMKVTEVRDGNETVTYNAVIIKEKLPLKVISIGQATILETEAYQNYRIGVQRRKADVQSYNDFWLPVDRHLDGIDHVFLAQDGVYSTLNVAGLRTGDSSFVIDKCNITVLSNSRAFLNKKKEEETKGNVYLFGNPDYSSSYTLTDLPGTEKEVKAIHALLDSSGIENSMYLLSEVTETRIKSLENTEILHIASHGFFKPAPQSRRSLQLSEKESEHGDNPMLRSGLLLSGAFGSSADDMAKGKDDGILTAYEVMNLDLRNTKMVILSACETGLGDIVEGQGVYGLTRAFNVAGARLVLASLWEVDDYTTFKLMTETYREFAQTGDLKSAFLRAQLRIKEKRFDPSYWGAFVLIEN